MQKTVKIKVNKRLILNLIKSIFISIIIIFILQHFGRMEYSYPRSNSYYYAKYHTFFGGAIFSDTNFLTNNKSPEFGEIDSYFELLPYRILATIYSEEDFKYLLILIGIIWSIFIFRQYIRIKVE